MKSNFDLRDDDSNGYKPGKIAKGTAALLGVGLFIVLVIAASGIRPAPIQDGSYTGQVIDYSHQRGLFLKTDDLTTKTNDRSSTREDWCVPDSDMELVEKVRNIEPGQRIEIDYHNPLYVWPGTCQSGLKVVQSVTVVE